MTISEKVAYIQGMFDGMGLDKSESGEAKVLAEVLDVLREIGDQLDTVDATLDNCGESLVIDDEVLEAGVIDCPKCGQKFALDFGGEDDECGCGCDCGCDHDHE